MLTHPPLNPTPDGMPVYLRLPPAFLSGRGGGGGGGEGVLLTLNRAIIRITVLQFTNTWVWHHGNEKSICLCCSDLTFWNHFMSRVIRCPKYGHHHKQQTKYSVDRSAHLVVALCLALWTNFHQKQYKSSFPLAKSSNYLWWFWNEEYCLLFYDVTT